MKNQKIFVQESINRLTKLIESLKKDENHKPEALGKLKAQLAENYQELTRLKRIEWEETHERLGYGDEDR